MTGLRCDGELLGWVYRRLRFIRDIIPREKGSQVMELISNTWFDTRPIGFAHFFRPGKNRPAVTV